MVNMSVTQYKVLYLGRVKRKLLIIKGILRLAALELSAIQQYLVLICSNQMA
jgi:hypothetical protein